MKGLLKEKPRLATFHSGRARSRENSILNEGQGRWEWKNGAFDVTAKTRPKDPGKPSILNCLDKTQPKSKKFFLAAQSQAHGSDKPLLGRALEFLGNSGQRRFEGRQALVKDGDGDFLSLRRGTAHAGNRAH